MTPLTYQIESYEEFVPEGLSLLQKHYEELANPLDAPFIIDMGLYESLYKEGSLLLLTARDKGVMVGYEIIRLGQHVRSNGTLVADEEGLFLLPEYRKGNAGILLVQLGIRAAQAVGAEYFFSYSQECRPIGKLFIKLGFRKQAEIYVMKLEKDAVNPLIVLIPVKLIPAKTTLPLPIKDGM